MKDGDLARFTNLQVFSGPFGPGFLGAVTVSVGVFSRDDPDRQVTLVDGSSAPLGMSLREIKERFGSLKFTLPDPVHATEHEIDLSDLEPMDPDNTVVVIEFGLAPAETDPVEGILRRRTLEELGILEFPNLKNEPPDTPD